MLSYSLSKKTNKKTDQSTQRRIGPLKGYHRGRSSSILLTYRSPLPFFDSQIHMPQVLVVEDNIALRTMLVHQLDRLGIKADSAANGLEAVRRILVWQYDLILMDVQMPEMDGIEATGAIRAHEKAHGIKRSAIIGISASEQKERALDAGMDVFIQKPLLPTVLRQILDKWLPPEKRRHYEEISD